MIFLGNIISNIVLKQRNLLSKKKIIKVIIKVVVCNISFNLIYNKVVILSIKEVFLYVRIKFLVVNLLFFDCVIFIRLFNILVVIFWQIDNWIIDLWVFCENFEKIIILLYL